MRFLILTTDYGDFLRWLFARNPGLAARSFEEQTRVRMQTMFSVSDSYSTNLRKLGHEAHDVVVNNEHTQKAWAREHGLHLRAGPELQLRLRKGVVPWISRSRRWLNEILAAQIKHYKPDITSVWPSGSTLRPCREPTSAGMIWSCLPCPTRSTTSGRRAWRAGCSGSGSSRVFCS